MNECPEGDCSAKRLEGHNKAQLWLCRLTIACAIRTYF